MKKIKLLLFLFMALLFIGITNVEAATNMNVYLLVEDAAGDGWDGEYVQILNSKNGETIGEYVLFEEKSHLYTIPLPVGQKIEVYFISPNYFETNCIFKLGYDSTFNDVTKLITEKQVGSVGRGTITYIGHDNPYTVVGESYSITGNNPADGAYSIVSKAAHGSTVTISDIVPKENYWVKEIKILKASDNSDATSLVNYSATSKTFTMPDYALKVNVEFEPIPMIVKGNSVYRDTYATASIRFNSTLRGTYYYLITDVPTIPSVDSIIEANNTGTALAGVNNILISNMSLGAKYVHILVKSNNDKTSDILTIEMPYNTYFFDDFEAYQQDTLLPTSALEVTNTTPQIFLKYNGGDSNNQKVINYSNNSVLQEVGAYGIGLDSRVKFASPVTSGQIVLETDIIAIPSSFVYLYGSITIIESDVENRDVIAGVNTEGKFSAGNASFNTALVLNQKHHVKIVLDVETKKYDYYVDGLKLNEEPISADDYAQINYVGIYNGSGTVYYDNYKFYATQELPAPHAIIKIQSNGTFNVDNATAKVGDIVTISSITPTIGYQLKEVKILKASDDSDITTTVNYDSTSKTFTMPNYAVKVNIVFEKIPYIITINGENLTINPISPINVLYGDNKEITITPNTGYILKSVKVDNDKQALPLTDNKILLNNITKNIIITVETEKIIYNFDNDSENVTYKIGTETDLSLRVKDTNIENFDKIYVNNVLLNKTVFDIASGSIVLTLKDTYLRTLENGTHNLKVTTKDGGEATTAFVITNSQVGLEENPNTDDGVMNSILLGSISIMGIIGCGLFLNKKKRFNQ